MRLIKLLCVIILFLFAGFSGWTESMAIPNAVTGEGVYPALSVTIADKIAEELVASGLYEILDRTYVEQVLNEQEFQLSGLVSEADVKKAGDFLGADYVCVSRVSRIEMFYVISAKIISVETGRIIAQTSAEEEGSTAVIFELSNRVGKQLVQSLRGDQPETEIAGTVFTEEEHPRRKINPPQQEQPAPQEPSQETRPEPFVQQPAAAKPKRSHLTFSWMLPQFAGTAIDAVEASYSYPYSYDLPTNGFDMHLLLDMTNSFYLGMSLGYGWQDFVGDDGYEAEDFNVMDLRFTFGMLLPMGRISSFYFGGGLNYVLFTLGDNWVDEYAMEDGLGLSFEGGLDFYLSDLCLSARLNYTYVPELSAEEVFYDAQDLNISSLILGAGFRF